MCPSCGTTSFFSAPSGDKIVFHVSDSCELIMVPGQTIDEFLFNVNPWRIYCDACSWSGPIHDLTLAEA